MSFTDPTSGQGYGQNSPFPSSHATYIADSIGKALDKTGDTIANGSTIQLQGALLVSGLGQIRFRTVEYPNTASFTMGDEEFCRFTGASTASFNAILPAASTSRRGAWKQLSISALATAGVINVIDGVTSIATMDPTRSGSLIVWCDGSNWYCGPHFATPAGGIVPLRY
ncbi:MAG: hypothetical protein AAF715_32585 [Myxococcota bacterium]